MSSPNMKQSPKNSTYHKPVLLQTALKYLHVTPGRLYIDATIGGGGHTAGILQAGGRVLGLDQDSQALDACRQNEAFQPALASGSLILVHTNFSRLLNAAAQKGWSDVSGILLDLGVSSRQLDTTERGFSFRDSGPLDMRMDIALPVSAADLVNRLPAPQLASLFADFGDIPEAKPLARKLVSARPVNNTGQLAALAGKWARQAFQALRIAVNDELGALEAVLPQSYDLLAPGGRLVVISYHSLEDRLVKELFKAWSVAGRGQMLTTRPLVPDSLEISDNPRSRSAKLRAFSKLPT